MPSSLMMRMRIGSFYLYPRVPDKLREAQRRSGTPVSSRSIPTGVPHLRWTTARGQKASLRAAPRAGHVSGMLDPLHPTHVRRKRVRHRDGAVLLLVRLHHRDQRAADGDTGAVEGVDEANFAILFRAIACGHAARLEIAAHRAGGNLAKSLLSRQPDLDVVGLLRGKSHVAGAQRHHAIVDIEAAQNFLGAAEHALVLVLA